MSASRALSCGLHSGDMARGLPNGKRVFDVCWIKSLTKSPVPAQRTPSNRSMAVHSMEWLGNERSRSVRRSESVLNTGMLEYRRAIWSIIVSVVYIKFDDSCNV